MEQCNALVLKKDKFRVQDHFKTKETFELKWNPRLSCYETFPKPDEEEVQSYYDSEEYISHQKGIGSIKDVIYHLVRRYMIRAKLNWIKKAKRTNAHLLDIGCGVGEFLHQASQSGLQVMGIEPNEKARNIAKQKNLDVRKDIKDLNDEQFDVISMWHVLEHLHKPETFLKNLHHLLKAEGLLFIAAPNYKSYDAMYYKEFWAAYDVPRHLYHFSKESIGKLAQECGYQLQEVYPLQFDSYYVAMLSEKYKHGKAGIKWLKQGWKSNYKAKASGEWSSLVYVLKKSK